MIDEAAPVPVVSVVAPPGYGKSTLLAQWAAANDPDSAWVSCDEGDNDPAVLMACLATALARLGAIDEDLVESLTQGAGITAVPGLMDAIRPGARPAVLVLDQVEAITNRECQYILAEVALRLPPGWQIAMASRHALPLPLPRLRLQGGVLELGAGELAMSADEARRLLHGTGAAPDDAALVQLLDSTEGWPMGLYLAGLTVKAGAGWRAVRHSGADGEDVRRYLRAEILEQISDGELAFLTRSSVLPRLCGSLCDATVGGTGSARLLEQLERRNLLVVPLDRRREWYRYHHLFRDMLTEELRRRELQLVPQLHARAAAWFEAHDLADEAIEHAQKAGDPDLVARLVLEHMQPVWASGRADTVLRWTTWLDREGALHRYPGIAIHGALIFALLGRVEEAEAWATIARTAPTDVLLPDGNTTGSLLAYLRAILAQDGVEAMRADARASFAELAPSSPYRVTMLFTEGMSYLLEADLDRADPILALAREDAERVGTLPLAAMILAERCVVAERRNDSARVESLALQAVALVEEGGFDHYWTSALVYACAARAALGRGDVRGARLYAAHCTRLRPLLVYSIPVAPVQTLLELARVYLALGDAGGAEAALQQAEEILAERPRLGVLGDEARELRGTLDRVAGDPDGASSLTTAELRLLPLLATHLSLGQIGERLHVARATVKAQTTSIYRKLRVSSRGDAVSRSRELGLDVR
jgi:LuxR family maltose regulon positive regulatory protein